jgi:F420-non-reducing hydrogenase iron-sulfur subunit
MRLSYPTSVRIIRVPCTGRVDVLHLLKALEGGADGVYVAGCLEGDCHYQNGNLRAKKRVAYVREILQRIGLGAERVGMYNLSAGMGPRFAEIVAEVTDKVARLGPSPIRLARKAAMKVAGEAGG